MFVENVDGVARQSPSATITVPVALQAVEATAVVSSTAALADNENVKEIKNADAGIFT